MRVQLGGPTGPKLTLHAGDVVLLPAGTSHCNLGGSVDLIVLRGDAGDRPAADRNIAAVQLPDQDPLTGATGGPADWK